MPVQAEEKESKIYFAGLDDRENERINEELKTMSKRAEILASLFFEWLDNLHELRRNRMTAEKGRSLVTREVAKK